MVKTIIDYTEKEDLVARYRAKITKMNEKREEDIKAIYDLLEKTFKKFKNINMDMDHFDWDESKPPIIATYSQDHFSSYLSYIVTGPFDLNDKIYNVIQVTPKHIYVKYCKTAYDFKSYDGKEIYSQLEITYLIDYIEGLLNTHFQEVYDRVLDVEINRLKELYALKT